MHILKLMEQMRIMRKEQTRKPWALFIDLKSAFDKVNHTYLFKEMERYGVSEELTDTIAWMYMNTQFVVGDEQLDIENGVFQGGVMSPTLFIIVFNSIIKQTRG